MNCELNKILVVRFRQMGDAILSTSLLNTLRRSFPQAEIHFVLNQKIAPLFEGHPSIDRIITFTDEERHNALTYIKKVWKTVHQEHYDVIIDMRSTMNTMLFALFSPSTKYRIGIKKGYTRLAFNHLLEGCGTNNMVVHDAHLARPLEAEGKIDYTTDFTLCITDEERNNYKTYLKEKGINADKPVMLANVTAKLADKVWNEERMVEVLDAFIKNHPEVQIIFNFAPGQEEENALRIYDKLGKPQQVRVDIKAKSPRELVALCENITLFFGNEGGARHIAHAAGVPSLVVCAPGSNKEVWIPQNSVPAKGIAASDFASPSELSAMTRQQQYDLITAEYVKKELENFFQAL